MGVLALWPEIAASQQKSFKDELIGSWTILSNDNIGVNGEKTVMIGKAIDAEALALRDLSSEDLDAVSGGWFCSFSVGINVSAIGSSEGTTGQNDPAAMFQQILQHLYD